MNLREWSKMRKKGKEEKRSKLTNKTQSKFKKYSIDKN